ncbi:hypothetical protein N7478_010792 [Penicillium angulare]|uniref:uncharacterized protein n=1 Tax=Penicillium angulare TaxID=116970 RepID=UPI00254167BF|nr:uncharacterized protein N7478_010792 [Penicillium angulare]KAJ5263187.1 hypothetical protein N7478_010792 [Penicillium angulare]
MPPNMARKITDNADLVRPIGFEPLSYEPVKVDDIRRPLWNQTMILAMEELANGIEASGDSVKAEALRKTLELASSEFEKGAGVEVTWFYFIAKKL